MERVRPVSHCAAVLLLHGGEWTAARCNVVRLGWLAFAQGLKPAYSLDAIIGPAKAVPLLQNRFANALE
jgi:hypothetical protein